MSRTKTKAGWEELSERKLEWEGKIQVPVRHMSLGEVWMRNGGSPGGFGKLRTERTWQWHG
jgi:hypothetical protein